ncbi:MAG: hypothetical protein KatS3mg057_2849 [Herpetosiphonaceae bacterium]|nr:MAG: hypothetical protein KatS3mg057_2849 [Herpetosiphonaceae bacterium]
MDGHHRSQRLLVLALIVLLVMNCTGGVVFGWLLAQTGTFAIGGLSPSPTRSAPLRSPVADRQPPQRISDLESRIAAVYRQVSPSVVTLRWG